ncbi:hypothetical protein HS088_TW17G00508 [Tripterygium wilfordii]|uniref:Uncharacterized protein n=1 Tax=Tripterygium wilfordii TaxID=458696 RepID=A0A7J7CFK8_TRIWF|nr:uncharacterized protein LOC119981818 [Tripterygium wilfordii]KAF5732974.1 hypothetical protein HS088_TW17G00508 [Tripterygium wilfordii]
MDGFRPLWNYQETIDELKQKVVYKTIELESLKTEASEQIHRQKEDINHLINYVRLVHQERDRYERLLNMFMPSNPTEMLPEKENSIITESNSALSETNNNSHYSHGGSPPVNSFFDAVSSSWSINAATYSGQLGAGAFVNQPFTGSNPSAGLVRNVDAVIESVVKGKALPQKGKLLQAVMEAGPLLQTLIDSGPPLPRWTNPPTTLLKPFEIPPETVNSNPNAAAAKQSGSYNCKRQKFH